ncbi:MAG: tRNA dihydrouridine synthase DusB [Gemmatimonadetes bacterium]|nr:tRNA dihydrouridine synthase DusB [Gemmatimonadota bacterium]MEC8930626.1 tRNA-dihydrouridine synthase [Candidatus Latescibacterota bacterium]
MPAEIHSGSAQDSLSPSEPAFHIGHLPIAPLAPNMPVMALAPMAGVGNWAFRLICASLGARIVGVEFINCRVVHHKGHRIERLLDFTDAQVYEDGGHSLLAAQIYGNDIGLLAAGAQELERRGSQVVDINFGCSVPQITRKGSCAAYLLDLDRFYDAVQATVEACTVPVTIKTRIGWDEDSINIVEVVERAQKAGAKAIAVHARTVMQKYGGKARWEWIRRAAEASTVPLIGNGDIRRFEDAVAMVEQTGCDAVQIGRAAIANPWIFAGRNGAPLQERLRLAIEQLRLMVQYKGERVGVPETRKHLVHYFRDLERGSDERTRLLTTPNLGELVEFLDEWRSRLPPEDADQDLTLDAQQAGRLAWSGGD